MKGALLAIFFSAYIGSINAAVITRTIDVELLSDWIGPGTDQSGNAGNRLLFEPQSVDPFFVQAGDVIVTQVNFLSPHALKLTDLGNNFYSTLGGASTNLEPVGFSYGYSDNSGVSGSSSVVNVSGQITWDVLSGIANPLSFSATSSGSGFPIFSKVTGSNITDSTVVITGFSIQSNINDYVLEQGNGEIDHFSGSFYAGNIELEAVPIPASAWLLGSAIGLLGWMRRQTA